MCYNEININNFMNDLQSMHPGDRARQLEKLKGSLIDDGPVGRISDKIFTFVGSRRKSVDYNPDDLLELLRELKSSGVTLEKLVKDKYLGKSDAEDFLKFCKELNKLAYDGQIKLSDEDRSNLIATTGDVGA